MPGKFKQRGPWARQIFVAAEKRLHGLTQTPLPQRDPHREFEPQKPKFPGFSRSHRLPSSQLVGMEGLGNNSVILLALCLLFSLLLIGPLMWMCFLNLTYRLRKFQRTQQVKDQVGSMERGLASLNTEVTSLVRKVTWLEGQLAVAECSSEGLAAAPPSYQESQREVERRADQSDPSRARGTRTGGGDVRQADMEEVARRLLANSRVTVLEEAEEEEREDEPPPLAPRGEERQAPVVERRSPPAGQVERQSMNISSQALPLSGVLRRTGETEHHSNLNQAIKAIGQER